MSPSNFLTNKQTNKQTPWKRALLEKPTDLHLVKKHPAFYGNPQFNYCHHNSPPSVPILSQINPVHAQIQLQYYSTTYALVLKVVSFPQVSLSKFCKHPQMLHAPPLSLSSIPSSKRHLMRNTDHTALSYVVFSTLLLLPSSAPYSRIPSANVPSPDFTCIQKNKQNYSSVHLVSIFLDSKLEYDSTPNGSKFNLLLISS